MTSDRRTSGEACGAAGGRHPRQHVIDRVLAWCAVPALRIAHLTATYPPYLGGAGIAAQQTADRLARRGHDVEVVTVAADGIAPASAARVRRLKPALAIGNAPLLP